MTLPPQHLQWEELPVELEFIGDGIVEAGETIIYKYDGQKYPKPYTSYKFQEAQKT